MNLGKLLGAGKSFLGGRGTVSYRADKHVYLPKFNSGGNPFVAKAVESVPASVQPAAKKVSAPSVAPVAVKTQKFSAPPSARPVRAAGWTTRLNPFRTSEPVAPSPASAVQVELSLDAVKVVHNDLADADIEIVPVKSRTVAVMEAPVLPPARQAWEFMGERLMSAD